MHAVVEQAMRHCGIKQGADHSTVHDASVSLPVGVRVDRRDDGVSSLRGESKAERPVAATNHAMCVACGRRDLDRIGLAGKIIEIDGYVLQMGSHLFVPRSHLPAGGLSVTFRVGS